MFGRAAGHERGDEHVTRACDAIERESGNRHGGKSRERSAGRERAGQESGRAECELDRGPGDADGSGREHEKAAGPKPTIPDVDLGMQLPPPASGQTTPVTPRDTLPDSDLQVLTALRESASRETVRLWAAGAPFAAKDELKTRGYRWMPEARNGIDRAWWTEVAPELVSAELAWLHETVYAGTLPRIPQRRVTAYDRWRADPADIAHRAPTMQVPDPV